MDTQNSLGQSNPEEVMASMGVESGEPSNELGQSEADVAEKSKDYDPLKKRLGMQAKKHEREMRAMQAQIEQLHATLGHNIPPESMQPQDPYGQQPAGLNVEEQIKRAVQYALRAQDEQKRMAEEAEKQAHVHKQYQRMNDEFDKASDKYDDFDDVVRGQDAPFTQTMRDALLLIDNPADVAYKLGKNRDELSRIGKLHPVDQAREVNKLSFALMGGNQANAMANANGNSKTMSSPAPKPVANSSSMSPQAIRARMKAGTWK